MSILQNTKNGKPILKYYEENKILHEEQRQLLIKTVATYIELNDISCSMTDCKEMEKQICSIFPNEELEYNNGIRGKLYSKIYNLKRLSKSVLEPKEVSQVECQNEYLVESDAEYPLTILIYIEESAHKKMSESKSTGYFK